MDHIYTWYKYSVQRSHPCSITSIKTKLKVKFWKDMAYQKESTFYLHKKTIRTIIIAGSLIVKGNAP